MYLVIVESPTKARTIGRFLGNDYQIISSMVHFVDLLKDTTGVTGKKARGGFRFQRIVFHEITKEAIQEALQHPRDIDMCLVSAQTARRVLDRLVGYKLSPLLWQKVRRGLSAGRVQSVAVRLIVEREREREKFLQKPYWTIHVLLKNEKHDTTL